MLEKFARYKHSSL
jgi:hypothetical protein